MTARWWMADDCSSDARKLRWSLACVAAGFGAAAVVIPFDGGDLTHSFGFATTALLALAARALVGMAETWRALAQDTIKRHEDFVDDVIRTARGDGEP